MEVERRREDGPWGPIPKRLPPTSFLCSNDSVAHCHYSSFSYSEDSALYSYDPIKHVPYASEVSRHEKRGHRSHILLSLLPARQMTGVLELDPLRAWNVLVVGRGDPILCDVVPTIDDERRYVDLVQTFNDRPPIQSAVGA